MNITLINGNMRHGSTWHCAMGIIDEIKKTQPVELTEFSLPRDLPHFCTGCFSCIYKGEETCPHRESMAPILSALAGADLIVLSSPVYGFDVSGQMKALIDHLCFMWMSHRPDPRMFRKVGLTVTTSAGAGLGHTAKTMKNSLVFWGVQRVFGFKFPVSAMKWDDVSEARRRKIEKKTARMAVRINRAVRNSGSAPNPLFRSFFFGLMKGMQKKNDWNLKDRAHWEAMGWLSGNKPF